MNAANAGFFRIVNLGVLHAFVMQIFKSLFSLRLEFIQLAEHDGFRGTRLGAGRFQACFLAIGAEGALEGAAIVGIALNHSKGAGDDAVAASVANVGLQVDGAEFGAHERAGWASLHATGNFAVLADVGGEFP